MQTLNQGKQIHIILKKISEVATAITRLDEALVRYFTQSPSLANFVALHDEGAQDVNPETVMKMRSIRERFSFSI